MSVLLNGKALKPGLIQMPPAGIVAVRPPSLGVGHGQPLHEQRQVAILTRPEDQMEMVGHESVRADAHVLSSSRLFQDTLERLEIGGIGEEFQIAAAAIHHMVSQTAGSN